ncbi:hypothetical protein [Prescottella defluvii]|uniref:hypothetical protein n=1 Tax=Prescottella defluvii TaxID=1323361 RepID=UPI0039ED5E49
MWTSGGSRRGRPCPNYFVKYLGGAAEVDKYVSLGPAWNGSVLTGPDGGATILGLGTDDARGVLPFRQAGLQFLPESQFIAKLHAGGLDAPEVTYTNIMARYDEGILPCTSGYVEGPNATNIVVQDGCSQDYSDRIALAASRVAAGCRAQRPGSGTSAARAVCVRRVVRRGLTGSAPPHSSSGGGEWFRLCRQCR